MQKIKTEALVEVRNMESILSRRTNSEEKSAEVENMDISSLCINQRLKSVPSRSQGTTEKSVGDRNMNASDFLTNQQCELKVSKSQDSAAMPDRDIWIKKETGAQVTEVKTLKKGLLQKPNLSYIALISNAIQSSRHKRMLLSDIYEWIVNNFPTFKMANRSWRNSVRHNLSLNECFIKCGRCDSGKGHYWGIHAANRDDFAKGDYRRRHARRLVKKCDELAQLFDTDPTNDVSQKPSNPMTSQYGYALMTCTTVSNSYLIKTFGAAVLSTSGQWQRQQHFNEICEKRS
ncbi:forkhead box protein F2-like [Gigantopelta aegis]|uniref:forkhead box protein F2-like n=1 Tax=Gigantopelta aegis TaxID=1735272 RepID=UPI001B88AEFB|nr:forkhead box protein F2-like [Gigantopelta aegis]